MGSVILGPFWSRWSPVVGRVIVGVIREIVGVVLPVLLLLVKEGLEGHQGLQGLSVEIAQVDTLHREALPGLTFAGPIAPVLVFVALAGHLVTLTTLFALSRAFTIFTLVTGGRSARAFLAFEVFATFAFGTFTRALAFLAAGTASLPVAAL